jgi:hypothetical protein
MNCELLTKSVAPAATMMHVLKPTMQQLMGTTHAIKVGDWMEVLYAYAPGTCLDAGVGTVRSIDTDDDGST